MVDWNEVSKATKDAREQGADGAEERMRQRRLEERQPSPRVEQTERVLGRVNEWSTHGILLLSLPLLGLIVGGWIGLVVAITISTVIWKRRK